MEVILAISKGLFVGLTIASLFGLIAYILVFPWTSKQLMIRHGEYAGDRGKYKFWKKVYHLSTLLYSGIFVGMLILGLGSLIL